MPGGRSCRCGCDSKGVRAGFFLKKCYVRLKSEGITKVTYKGKEVAVEYVASQRPKDERVRSAEQLGSRGGLTYAEKNKKSNHNLTVSRSAARADASAQALSLVPDGPTLPVYDAIMQLAAFLLRKIGELVKDIPSGCGLVLNVFYAGAGSLHSKPEALSSLMQKSATLIPSASSSSGGAALFSKPALLALGWQYEAQFGGAGPVSRGAENVVHDFLFGRYKSLGYSGALERVMMTMRRPGQGGYYEGVMDSFAGVGWSYEMLTYDETTGVTTLSPGVTQGRITGGSQPGPVHAQDMSRGEAPGTLVSKALALAQDGSAVLLPPERTSSSLDVSPACGSLLAMTLMAQHGLGGRNAYYTVLADQESDGYLRYSVLTGGLEVAGAPFAIPPTHTPHRSCSTRSFLIHMLQIAYDKAWARGTGGSDNAASRKKYRLVYLQHAGATYIDEASPEGLLFLDELREKSAALQLLQQVSLSPMVQDAWAQVKGASKAGCGLPDIFAGPGAGV